MKTILHVIPEKREIHEIEWDEKLSSLQSILGCQELTITSWSAFSKNAEYICDPFRFRLFEEIYYGRMIIFNSPNQTLLPVSSDDIRKYITFVHSGTVRLG